MYGTVSRGRVKSGMRDEFIRTMQEDSGAKPPDGVALLVYQADSDPDEVWIAVVFESKEAYQANSESPEMKARLEKVAQYRDGAPEWHDGEVITPWG